MKKEENEKVAAGRVGILDAFRSRQTFLLCAILFLIITGNQAILFFLPSITNNMKGMSVTWRTAVTVLPYLFSVAGILLNGFSSSRTGERGGILAVPVL